jgi:hypothetical protein
VSGYLVSNHVHVCATPEAAILLDLRSDRYHGLAPAQSQSLAAIVEGWPRLPSETDRGESEPLPLATELVERGLLTRDPSRGRPLTSIQLPQVEAHLCDWDSDRLPRIQMSHVIRLGIACVRTLAQLRLGGMERTAEDVRARKSRQPAAVALDLPAMRELTYTYRALRPFFYRVRERCLYDSLVLMHFLAAHDVYPTWVIGVTPNPFSAHSWVQAGPYVLNSPPEYVRAYTPILAI